jgi:hypothetical protein
VPGMNSGLSPADPALVAAFGSTLLHQGAIAVILIALLWLLWATARTWRLTIPGSKPEAGNPTAGPAARGRRSKGSGEAQDRRPPRAGIPEAAGRRLLRIGFELIWILDGLLQAQPKMAGGLASQVIKPTARGAADMGPAPGQLGRSYVVLPPRYGRCGGGMDPGRYRRLARRHSARAVV